jgi:hypothetical protein
MSAFTGVFGKSPGQLRAEQALEEAEDQLMAFDEAEATNLSFHARRDADRVKVIVSGQRLLKETMAQAANRNIVVTIVIGIILFAKGIITPDAIAAAFKALGF